MWNADSTGGTPRWGLGLEGARAKGSPRGELCQDHWGRPLGVVAGAGLKPQGVLVGASRTWAGSVGRVVGSQGEGRGQSLAGGL